MFYRNQESIKDYYSDIQTDIKRELYQEQDDYIISTVAEDLCDYYLSKRLLTPIEFDPNIEESIKHEKYIKTIFANEREYGYQNEGNLEIEAEKIIVTLPIIRNEDSSLIFDLRTQSYSLSSKPDCDVSKTTIKFELEIKGYGSRSNLTDDEIVTTIDHYKSSIRGLMQSKNTEIRNENENIKHQLEQLIESRKVKLDSDNKRFKELVKKTNISLERKDADIVKKVKLDTKPFVKRLKPKPQEEDYCLDRNKVIDIIKLLEAQGLQFEKTPQSYSKLGEENLRDLLLSNLNSIFEGKATGETFNNRGKTDIYLNIDKGNILVSECKIYGGKKLYHNTIDQILGYLTWRQNFGIMINFCRKKSFTKILSEAKDIITSHSSYKNTFYEEGNSHFRSNHILPTDPYKSVEIHHIYFNLYTG